MKKITDTKLKASFKNFDTNSSEFYTLSEKSKIILGQLEMLKSQNGKFRTLNCPPQNSDFYLPGSIGSKVDIPLSLKNKIDRIQNPTGENFIPAKNYHIYDSAFLSCKMVSNGMSVDQATTVQKQAARFYRGLRMCESAKNNLKIREGLSATAGGINIEDSKKIEATILEIWNRKNKKTLSCPQFVWGGGFMSQPSTQTNSSKKTQSEIEKDSNECNLLNQAGIANLEPNEQAIAKKKINTAFSKYDAALLYDKWYVGGDTVFGQNIPCTDLRLQGPKDLMNPDKGIMGVISKPSNWSDERYKAASAKLATWDLDFEWTVAQHEVGSKFGANICKNNSKKNPFSNNDKQCLKPAFENSNGSFEQYNYQPSNLTPTQPAKNSR